jgi:hypothetical protein
VAIDAPDGEEWEVEGTVTVAAQAGERTFRAKPYVRPLTKSPIPTASLGEVLEENPFLDWDAAQHSLLAGPGRWDVSGSLVLPDGVGLRLEAGAELRFQEGEMVVASGPLVFSGTAEQLVVLTGAGAEGRWGGIVALRSERPHVFTHAVIRDTDGIDRNGWTLTGGVTLCDADARISDSSFRGNRAEDALNLFRSSFRLENVEFSDTSSDALDVDFSNGVIRHGSYSNVGGDAIDVSGGEVDIEDVRFERVRDKAVSVGEASSVHARRLRIDRVGTHSRTPKSRTPSMLESWRT